MATESSSNRDIPSLNILDNPEALGASIEDPLYHFLVDWWRVILAVVIAGALVFYAVTTIKETTLNSRKLSADLFSNVRQEFSALAIKDSEVAKLKSEIEADKAKKPTEAKDKDALTAKETRLTNLNSDYEASKQRLSEMLMALGDSADIYGTIAKFYRGMFEVRFGDFNDGLKQLQSFKEPALGSVPEDKRLVYELALLYLGKRLLDEKADLQKEGVAVLFSMGESANYFGSIALLALQNNKDILSAEEGARLDSAIKMAKKNHPEDQKLWEEIQ